MTEAPWRLLVLERPWVCCCPIKSRYEDLYDEDIDFDLSVWRETDVPEECRDVIDQTFILDDGKNVYTLYHRRNMLEGKSQ